MNEVTFTADVAGWFNTILDNRSDLPFARTKIEESAKGKVTRRDLTVYDKDGNEALMGEAASLMS